jgi:hypothetical protein
MIQSFTIFTVVNPVFSIFRPKQSFIELRPLVQADPDRCQASIRVVAGEALRKVQYIAPLVRHPRLLTAPPLRLQLEWLGNPRPLNF